jgi:hypothetical protein
VAGMGQRFAAVLSVAVAIRTHVPIVGGLDPFKIGGSWPSQSWASRPRGIASRGGLKTHGPPSPGASISGFNGFPIDSRWRGVRKQPRTS